MKHILKILSRNIASHAVQTITVFGLLLAAVHSAEAQKPKLKLLEYNLPEDSLIFCALGPYYVEESVQRQPGKLVDERIVYSHNRWSVMVRELSVSSVADEFSMHLGDTVTVETCEYLPDSSRAVLRRFLEANGLYKLIRTGTSSNPTDPILIYDIIFEEPTQLGPVADYVDLMQEDRRTVIAITRRGGCFELHTSVLDDSGAKKLQTQVVEGDLRISEQGEYAIVDLSGRVIAQGKVEWAGQTQAIAIKPGLYFVMTRTSRQQVLVLP